MPEFRFDEKGTGRSCGSCTLCCKLVPVKAMDKPAGVKCRHARYGKGCSIYVNRPFECRAWSCRWMADARTAGLPRPDRAHYVVDLQYDYIGVTRNEGAEPLRVCVLQVWVDPAYPDAHREPGLRQYMKMLAELYGVATLVRWNNQKGMVVFPPTMESSGEWMEITSDLAHAPAPNMNMEAPDGQR